MFYVEHSVVPLGVGAARALTIWCYSVAATGAILDLLLATELFSRPFWKCYAGLSALLEGVSLVQPSVVLSTMREVVVWAFL